RSTSSTSWPARASAAPVTPPIAPAPYTVIVIESLPTELGTSPALEARGAPAGQDAPVNLRGARCRPSRGWGPAGQDAPIKMTNDAAVRRNCQRDSALRYGRGAR